MNQLIIVCLIVIASSVGTSAFPNLLGLPSALLEKVPKVGSSFWLGRCPQTTELEGGFDVNSVSVQTDHGVNSKLNSTI